MLHSKIIIIMHIKEIFLFLIFVGTVFDSFAQEYRPTLVQGAQWNQVNYFEGPMPYSLIIDGDTIFENRTYKIVREVLGDDAYMREDNLEKKIYILKNTNPVEEEMLYDYSLEVGDFFGEYRVDSIKNELRVFDATVLDFDLDTRIFYLSGPFSSNDYITWIEGIGSAYGLKEPTFEDFLICHFDSSGVLGVSIEPSFGTVENCMVLNTNNLLDLIEGDIYPNPSASNLNLSLKEYIVEGSLFISDITGKTIKEFSFLGDEVQVGIQDLKSGVYILQIYDTGKLIGSRKFIKN